MTRTSKLAVAALMTISAACASGNDRPRPARVPDDAAPSHLRIRLSDGSIQQVALEDYVRGTIVSEFAPAAGDPALVERMLEVQAVIARSYALAHLSRHRAELFDLCSTTHCQLYQPERLRTSRWAAAAGEAAARTSRQVLWYESGVAETLFHADCGGHLSAASDVWGGLSKPYLRAAADDGPAQSAHAAWTFEVDAQRLLVALNADQRTRVGTQLQAITILERDAAGRAGLVGLRGTREPLVRGEELRSVIGRAFGARSVRSTRFEVRRKGSGFVFEGRGFGHGVGLCQAGALARLKAGARPDDVLARYYPGTRLIALPTLP